MKLILEIVMDNDAFRPSPGHEASRILESASNRLRNAGCEVDDYVLLRDNNGNTVGSFRVTSGTKQTQ